MGMLHAPLSICTHVHTRSLAIQVLQDIQQLLPDAETASTGFPFFGVHSASFCSPLPS